MTARTSTIALFCFASLSGACGSDDDPGASTPTAGAGGSSATGGSSASGGTGGSTGGSGGTGGAAPVVYPSCTSDDNAMCHPSGFSFAQVAFGHSTACEGVCDPALASGATVHFSQPESGKLCVSGSTDASDTGIVLDFTVFSSEMLSVEYAKVLALFNADLHDITHVRFTIDDPPPGGVQVAADTMHSLECGDCITWGALLATPVTESGVPVTVPLDDFFTQTGQPIDTRAFGGLRFDVGAGAFDYCLRDFDFLDADGNQVRPSP